MTYEEINSLEKKIAGLSLSLVSASESLAKARFLRDQEYSRLYLLGRSEPDKLGLQKPTEEWLKSAILLHSSYVEANKAYESLKIKQLGAQLDYDRISAYLAFERDFFLKTLNT